ILARKNIDPKKIMNIKRRKRHKTKSAVFAAALIATSSVVPTTSFAAPSDENPTIQPFGSSVYEEEVSYNGVKYGRIETRDVGEESNEVGLTYYTHYSLNVLSDLRNATFNLSIDDELKENVEEIKVKARDGGWISAEELYDGSFSFNLKDVLSRSLVGTNQQFDIKVIYKDGAEENLDGNYPVDIAVLDKNGQVVENTTDATYITSAESELPIEDSNKITASGLTLNPYEDEDNELNLDYMMHYKTNANNIIDGQFQFQLDPDLYPFVEQVSIKGRDGNFKPTEFDEDGNFQYAADSLVSPALIGIPQNIEVKIDLKDEIKNLPTGMYLFKSHQTDRPGDKIIQGSDNKTYLDHVNAEDSEEIVLDKPSVNEVTEGDEEVTGEGEPGSQVTVKDSDGNELGTGDVDEEGKYTVDLDSPAEEGDDLSVTQSQDNEDGETFESDPRNVTVQPDEEGSEGDIELDAPS